MSRTVAGSVALAAAVVLALYPNLDGFWGRDDFACLAVVRMIGSPLTFFTQDHFFAPHSIFRPLGFASMWFSERAFGVDYAPNAAFDIALHATVAVSLFALMLRLRIAFAPALVAAALFALHPAVDGSALWFSARFDVLCSLFTVASLYASVIFRDRPSWFPLLAALTLGLAAMLSKEIGLAAILGMTGLWCRWAIGNPVRRRIAFSAVAAAWLVAAIFFVWRWLVLGTFTSGVTGTVGLAAAVTAGFGNWILQSPGYLSFVPQMDSSQIVLVSLGVLAGAASLALAKNASGICPRQVNIDAVIVGVCLIVVPIAAQAPIAAFAAPLSGDMSAVEAAMQARLYYLQITGGVVLGAALVDPLLPRLRRIPRGVAGLSAALLVLAFASKSQGEARSFAARSWEISAVARAAVAAADPIVADAANCRLVFSGYAPAPEWGVYVSMDSIVKGIGSNSQGVRSCWIASDSPTFFHLQPANVEPADALPWKTALPWRRVGRMTYAYLYFPERASPGDIAGAHFLQYVDNRFDDITPDVLTGKTTPRIR